MVVVIAVFRFNTIGKFAALSYAPSQYGLNEDGLPTMVDGTTYESDGQQILRLFAVSVVFVIAQCCLGCFAAAPPSMDTLRKWGVDIENEEEQPEAQPLAVETH